MLTELALKDLQPVAEGVTRLIYQHPHDDRLLVKVLKPEMRTEISTQRVSLLRIRRRFGIYRTFARAIGEYLATRARLQEHPLFLERILGFVETDAGLGLVAEKVLDRNGELAPTLLSLVMKHGFIREIEEKIIQLRDEIIRHDIIIGDLSYKNILCGFNAVRGEYLVVIDGLGDKTWIPVNSLSKVVNRINNIRHFRRLTNKLKKWDPAQAGSINHR